MHDDSTVAGRAGLRLDLLLSLGLAVLLNGAWAVGDWANLRWLTLPDTDDMMRLAQVRDWIAGQRFDDWTQYRLAPPAGAPMHWSRINDISIAGLIIGLTPLLGRHAAEVAAVIVYPGLLFAVALALSARIARALWSADAAPTAIVLAALAYPANALFLPGRIDHHALQIVCTLGMILASVGRPSRTSGVAAGLLVALSLAIGLETVPQIAALAGALVVRWAIDGATERPRLGGFGLALAALTAALLLVARPTLWTGQFCDTFTPASTLATLLGAGLLTGLALATGPLRDWRWRLAAAALGGLAVLATTLAAYPACITGPYGQMDPFLRHAMIDNISEAIGLFGQPAWTDAIEIGGLMLVGCGFALWTAIRRREAWRITLPLVLPILVSTLLVLVQVRGAYVGAALVPPMLAGLVLAARARTTWRTPALLAAWIAATGLSYLILPPKIAAAFAPPAQAAAAQDERDSRACRRGDVWHQLDTYPAGTAMAAIDVAPFVIGGTHHGAVGAGYHRNNRGNRATYAFFLSRPDAARRIAAGWAVRYVVFCPGDFGELGVPKLYPDSLAARIQTGRPPAWLTPLPLRNTRLKLYRVE